MGEVYQFRRRRGQWKGKTRLVVAAALVLAIGAIQAFTGNGSDAGGILQGETVSNCRATDGDTIRCGDERIRLLAIDAPELPGHCREGRVCAPGDPVASTRTLTSAMTATMSITRIGTDRYGRTLAMVSGPRGDLSCWQLSQDQAIYRSEWDTGYRIARECPSDIL